MIEKPIDRNGSVALQNLHADPKLILEMAAGVEDPDLLAKKYGYPEVRWELLKNDPAFKQAVEVKRSELQRSGYIFKTKAALCAEDLLEDIYEQAKDPETPLTQKLDAFKTFTKLGGLEPKEEKQVATGPGFQITINLGEQSVTLGSNNVVDVTDVTEIKPENVTAVTNLPAGSPDELPEPPPHIGKTLDFDGLGLIFEENDDEENK
jgi:hypothetical protein